MRKRFYFILWWRAGIHGPKIWSTRPNDPFRSAGGPWISGGGYIGGDNFGVHFWKWWGPNGSALQKLWRTRSECTLKSNRDHIGMHSLKRKGSHGSAFVSDKDQMGVHSIFFNRDQIGVHSFIKLALGVHSHVIHITNIECTPIGSLSETNALPCGPIRFKECTPICTPLCFWECTPMWSVTIFGVHSHLVLITFKNALRSCPPYKRQNVFVVDDKLRWLF